MPRAYSHDLRRKLLEAYEAGAGSVQEFAKQFSVSWGYRKKIRAQQLRTGRKERPEQPRHGPARPHSHQEWTSRFVESRFLEHRIPRGTGSDEI